MDNNLARGLLPLLLAAGCSAGSTGAHAMSDAGFEMSAPSDMGGIDAWTTHTADLADAPADAPVFRTPLELMAKLAGLWSGPATLTPSGDFARMNVDFRAVDRKLVFGRVDLDATNALRMAVYFEQLGDDPNLVLRSSVLSGGSARDATVALESYDLDAGTWRFCDPTAGCEFLDARMTLQGELLTLDLKVHETPHMLWQAERVETRALPSLFPPFEPLANVEFPVMPRLGVTLTWTVPAPVGAQAWVTLSTTPCGPGGSDCEASRTSHTRVVAGATSTEIVIEQLHEGEYHLNAVIDRDGNFGTTLIAGAPDTVLLNPNPLVVVDSEFVSTSHAVSFAAP